LEEKLDTMNLQDSAEERLERFETAKRIFEDIEALLSTEKSRNVLFSTTTLDQLITIFEHLEKCFAESEDYEKCKVVLKWKASWGVE
jgi:hypothetical protein